MCAGLFSCLSLEWIMTERRTISAYQTGRWVDQYKFRYYVPARLNENITVDDAEAAMLIAEASLAVGRLDGYLRNIDAASTYIRHLWVSDALSWLRSEGSGLSFEEYHMPDSELPARKRSRKEETARYVGTIDEAEYIIANSSSKKLSVKALRAIHKQMMGVSKGVNRIPGMFRVEHIAVGGATLQDADYVPPHPDEIQQLMANLDEFLQSANQSLNSFVRVAMAHLQFLNIHPFADYNGRIVRLMTALMLVSEGLLCRPSVFVGNHIESHRRIYFDRMNMARESGNMVPWLKFMAVGIAEGAKESLSKITAAERLVSGLREKFSEDQRRAANNMAFLKLLTERVAVCSRDVMEALDITMPTVNTMIDNFVKAGVLVETTGQKKNRIYLFKDFCDIFGK